MGTYLSTPVTDKQKEEGQNLDCSAAPLAWGAVDMQGWRKSMEDAHVGVVSQVPLPLHLAQQNQTRKKKNPKMTSSTTTDDSTATTPNTATDVSAKIFGVFDGHGGPEVARFCQLYLVSVLSQQPTWIQSQEEGGQATTEQDNNNKQQQQYLDNPSKRDMGIALRMTFHALDRMIDAPEYRDELIRLRSIKPALGEQKEAIHIPPPRPLPKPTTMEEQEQQEQQPEQQPDPDTSNNNLPPATPTPTTSVELVMDPHSSSFETEKKDDDSDAVAGKEEAAKLDQDLMNEDDEDSDTEETPKNNNDNNNNDNNSSDEDDDDENDTAEPLQISNNNDANNNNNNTQIPPLSQDAQEDTSGDDADTETEEETSGTAGKMSVMLQRLLQMSSSPPASPSATATRNNTVVHNDATTQVPMSAANAQQILEQHGPPTVDSTLAPASLVQNGRYICNLPDHAIHAGATAVVAVLHGNTLTVANAGDSRGVLCRDGVAFPLSFDHKPASDVESSRISHAGGFVNHFGRVNGNLNLSRSVGDLKYKQVARCTAAEQMITAEPDILQVELDLEQDEFFILACDGIWDCLTNQEAVDYVKQRLDDNDTIADANSEHYKSLTDIGAEMLDDILSTDPRVTQGIGGDNMTVLIVDLQPLKRLEKQQQQQAASSNDETNVSATPPVAEAPVSSAL